MKKLEIIEVDNDTYTLKDNENNIYIFGFEFHDIESLPQKGEYIYMSDELLNTEYKEYSTFYAFGSLNNISGRKIENNENIQDIITIETNNQNIKRKHLKRLYG